MHIITNARYTLNFSQIIQNKPEIGTISGTRETVIGVQRHLLEYG